METSQAMILDLAPAAIVLCVCMSMCVCVCWCISLIIRALLGWEHRRLVFTGTHTHSDESKSARLWGKHRSQMDHAQSCTLRNHVVQIHICCTECTCQGVKKAKQRMTLNVDVLACRLEFPSKSSPTWFLQSLVNVRNRVSVREFLVKVYGCF